MDAQWVYDNLKDEAYLRRVVLPLGVSHGAMSCVCLGLCWTRSGCILEVGDGASHTCYFGPALLDAHWV